MKNGNDNEIISVLKDNKNSLENSFKKIEKELESANKSNQNKKEILKDLKLELESIENTYESMKTELKFLKSEENKENWEKIISQLKKEKENYKNKIDDFDTSNFGLIPDTQNDDHLNLDIKIDPKNLNIQQIMERGDKYQDEMDKAINRMLQLVYKGKDTMIKTNEELNGQQQKLDNINDDLKKINISLDKAKKQITNMFNILRSDKKITCLIITILIIIITIIIVSACGGDNTKNFNVPHDIFFSNNNNTNTNQGEFFDNRNIIKYLFYLHLILFYI